MLQSFYKPNRRKRELESEEEWNEDTNKKTVESTDILGLALDFYNRLTDWRKLKLYELFFILILITICIREHDLASMLELFILCVLALPSSLMIPHWCYSFYLIVECVSMAIKYCVQLPFFRQCVNDSGQYYITFFVPSVCCCHE